MTARTIDFQRNLGGAEDLALGVGKAPQTRNGVAGEVTRINADVLPYDGTKSIGEAIREGHHTNAAAATPDNIQWQEGKTLRQEITESFAGKATKDELAVVARQGVSEWDNLVFYASGDVVEYGNSLYIAKVNHASHIPTDTQVWKEVGAGSETDLSGHATTAELQAETTEREEADTALGVRDTAIEAKAEQAIASASALAQQFMDLPEFPTNAEMVEAARLAREANALQGTTNATDISAERTARLLADTTLLTRITSETTNRVAGDAEAYRRITALGVVSTPAQITQSANNAITTSIASGSIKLALDEIVVSGGGLQLADFEAGTGSEQLCTVSGEDILTGTNVNEARLSLECNGETPSSGSATLTGEIRFTSSSTWNGKFLFLIGSAFTHREATFVSGGGSEEQVWVIEGIDWDFADTSIREVLINTNSDAELIPETFGFTFTFSGELTRGNPAGQAVDAIRILVEEAQTPDLFQTAAANIAFNHPFKESPATQTVPAVETFNFGSDFEGIETGRVVKIDSYFDFDLNPSNGSLPRCELTIMQAGRILFYQDYMDAQTANPVSYKAVAGGGQIQFIGKATSTNELTQLVHMYTSDQTVYFEGKYAAIFNQLMEAGIALATASLKSRLTNLENLPVQDITALQNSYNDLLNKVNNPVLQALSQGSVSTGTGTTTSRSALGDTLGAVVKGAESLWVSRVLFNMGDLRAFPNLTAGNQQTVIGEVKDGAFYGKVAPRIVPAHTDTVDNAFTPFPSEGIALGVQNQHLESSHSFPPILQIPAGAVVQARLAIHIAGSNDPAEFNLVSGENNVFTNSGETLTVFFDVVDGVPRIRISEGGENSLPLDNGTLTGFIRYTNAVAQTTTLASEVRLFEMTRNAPLIVMQEGEVASTASNTVIIYGNNQRHDTGYFTAYANYYIDNRGGLTGTDPEFYTVADSDSYDLTLLDADAYRMGLWTKDIHPSQKVELLTGLEITNPDNSKTDVGAELIALKNKGSSSGAVVGEFGDRLIIEYPAFEVVFTNSNSNPVLHDSLYSCLIDGASLEVLEDLSEATTASVIADIVLSSLGTNTLSKVGDIAYYIPNSFAQLDSANDIRINLASAVSGKVRLVLYCRRPGRE